MSVLRDEETVDPTGVARRPLKGWVKVAGTAGAIALGAATLFGLRYVGLFRPDPVMPRQVQKGPMDDSGFHYPVEAQPVIFRGPAMPQPTAPAPAATRAPVAMPDQRGQAREVTPLTSGILALGGEQAGQRPAATPASAAAPDADASDDALAASLHATKLDEAKVQELGDPEFTISQGRFIKCKQVTALNTTHPGGVVAEIDENVRSDAGHVVLLDRGATLFGVVQRAMANGTDTAFVLWQNIRTVPLYDRNGMPHHYRITVNSGATTDTGETGLPGDVDHHLWSKIPAMIGVSLLQALPAAAGSLGGGSNNRTGTSVNFVQNGGQGVQSAIDSWLGRILSEPDTLRRLQGQPCAMIVMRDLNLHGAYRLRAAR